MRSRILKIVSALSLSLCIMPVVNVQAEEPVSLESRIAEIREKYNLDDASLAVAYENTVTGEKYDYNGRNWMFAASTYKLPLNMYYYMQEASGAISSDEVLDGFTLADAHYLTLVVSNNDAAHAMAEALETNGTEHYEDLLFQTFGDDYYQNSANIDPITYTDNYLPADFLMNVLEYLNAHREDFPEMLSYLSSDEQTNSFDNNVRNYCTVWQKQGWYDYVNNVAEMVDSEEPYLAVIMVDHDGYADSDEIASEVNDAVYAYNTEMHAARPPVVETAESGVQEEKKEPEMNEHVVNLVIVLMMILSAIGAGCIACLDMRNRRHS